MSYQRVIPRDLFNEGNLLKCYGKLCLDTERFRHVRMSHDGGPFEVVMDDDGNTTIANVVLSIGSAEYPLSRPINSRDPWPLYLMIEDGEEIEVFDGGGALSADMQALIEGHGGDPDDGSYGYGWDESSPLASRLLEDTDHGWTYDGVQKGLDGEPYCHNYTDRREGSPTHGATISVLHDDHPEGLPDAIAQAEARFASHPAP